MNRRIVLIAVILVIAVVAVIVFKFCISSKTESLDGGTSSKTEDHMHEEHEHGSSNRIEISDEALNTISFETIVVEKREIEKEIRTTAAIEPDQTRISHVGPRIPGRVIEVKALLGDNVEKGEVLSRLDSLEMGKTKSEYLKAKANLEIARTNYEREKRLYEKKISSEKDYLDSRGEFLRSEAQLKSTQEALRLLGLSDEEIRSMTWGGEDQPLSHFPLIAPFSGTVIEKHTVLGELIEPHDKPYTIADLSKVWIQIDIYENDLRWIEKGTDVDIRVNAYPEVEFGGNVAYISDMLDESTRTARARVEIHNSDRRLKPGMFATAVISIPSPELEESIAVPDSAVYKVHDKQVVFVHEEDGIFSVREIKTGKDAGNYIEVLSGVNEGEKVVTKGGFHLKSTYLKEELGGGHGH